MTTTISVIGLGLMGRPMARVLLAAGYEVRGWNRSLLAEELVQDIPRCDSLAEAARAEVCMLMLADSRAVNAVLEQLEPHLTAGQVVLDMGTSDPTYSKVHAARLAEKGIGWVDAPVSGGPEGAAAGSLAVMAGASEANFAQVEPILHTLGGNVVRVGGPGAGHTAKIINQLIVGLTIEAVAEAITLAELSGLAPTRVQEALKGGFADSKVLQLHGSRMIARRYVPGAKATTQLKDLRLAQKLAAGEGLNLPHLESAIQLYETLIARGDGDLDHSGLHTLLGNS